MNITFCRYDSTGRYTAKCVGDEAAMLREAGNLFVGDIDIERYYHNLETNLPEEMPIRPSMFHLFDFTEKCWVLDSISAWYSVRSQRNIRIAESDWVLLPDISMPELKKNEWIVYRQQLRDVTSQLDPLNIAWPTPPQ